MRGDDKTMNSMNHNGQPSIDDEGTGRKDSISETVLSKYYAKGESTNGREQPPLLTNNGIVVNSCSGVVASSSVVKNGNETRVLPGSGGLSQVSPQSDTGGGDFSDAFEVIDVNSAESSDKDDSAPFVDCPTSPRSRVRPPARFDSPFITLDVKVTQSDLTDPPLPAELEIPQTQTPPPNSPNAVLSSSVSPPVATAAASPPHSSPTAAPPESSSSGAMSHSLPCQPGQNSDEPNVTNGDEGNSSDVLCRLPTKSATEEIDSIVARQQSLQTQIHQTNLKNNARSLLLIRRLLAIRARLNNGLESEHRVSNAEPRAMEYHIATKAALVDTAGHALSHTTTPETDESDLEDVGFTNDKIGVEQKKIRQREKLEEQRTAMIEAKRVWLIKNIERCSKRTADLEELIANRDEEERPSVSEDSCARALPLAQRMKKARPQMIKVPPLPVDETKIDDLGNVADLDNGYHHILSDIQSIPLSIRLGCVLHQFTPSHQVEKGRKGKERNRQSRLSSDNKQRRLRQKDQNIENNIVVPPSSLYATIEMPKYKDIDTPGFRSPDSTDFTSDPSSESDEDMSDSAFIRRHIRAEKKEKERYYQSAISQSRKRKKMREEIAPRLASPTEESYAVDKSEVRTDCYKKREYPLPDPAMRASKRREKAAKKQRQEWRSSTTEGNGLRLKLSLRKT